jgi:gamma-glutamyltranspeptidase/glutathione hydrolase
MRPVIRRFSPIALAVLLCLAVVIGGCGAARTAQEAHSPWRAGAMATAANPHAVDAAMTMLRRGGHAVDAAIAAHAVLGLVEPQSSGLGGGAFMLVYDHASDALLFHDGRETAPAAATADMFMRDGQAMGFVQAWQSGLSVGVPGVIRLYEDAHARHGELPWADLFQPAIELARNGFQVSPRLAGFLPRLTSYTRLDENPGVSEYFYPGGKPLEAGHLLRNPPYADTLARIAAEGSAAFYTGDIARAIVAAASAEPEPGTLTLEDLAAYRTVTRDAVCAPVQELRICGPTPPSSAAAVIMMLDFYQRFASGEKHSGDRIAALVDAQRLAYADRDHFFGDPDAVPVPVAELLNPRYLESRAGDRFDPGAKPTHGDPIAVVHGAAAGPAWAADRTEEVAGTSHLSIVDAQGNAVSMTATVEAPFGSARWAAGFVLNNELTDFAREYHGQPQANMVRPGRRPRSSMSPIMVFDSDGNLKMVTGSPGGNSIPAYVLKSLVGVLDWGLSPQAAADFPNVIARGEEVRVEVSVEGGQAIADDLKARGYLVEERQGENSGIHLILVEGDTLKGAADSRREGTVGYLPAKP